MLQIKCLPLLFSCKGCIQKIHQTSCPKHMNKGLPHLILGAAPLLVYIFD